MTMSGRLDDKVVLVTGGASGIGFATTEACARERAIVVMTDIDADTCEAQAQQLRSGAFRVDFLQLDVTREADWRRVADEVL
jgi:NAD(P)-dependent dehydrogenase (short-subunit alcohol dehydrogenase family)